MLKKGQNVRRLPEIKLGSQSLESPSANAKLKQKPPTLHGSNFLQDPLESLIVARTNNQEPELSPAAYVTGHFRTSNAVEDVPK